MIIKAVTCKTCNDMLFKRTEYDIRTCHCGSTSIGTSSEPSKKQKLKIDFTAEDLYTDYNDEIDQLGVIRPSFTSDKAHLKTLIKYTKRAVEHNEKNKGSAVHLFFVHQLNRLKLAYARLNQK